MPKEPFRIPLHIPVVFIAEDLDRLVGSLVRLFDCGSEVVGNKLCFLRVSEKRVG